MIHHSHGIITNIELSTEISLSLYLSLSLCPPLYHSAPSLLLNDQGVLAVGGVTQHLCLRLLNSDLTTRNGGNIIMRLHPSATPNSPSSHLPFFSFTRCGFSDFVVSSITCNTFIHGTATDKPKVKAVYFMTLD